MSDRRKPFRVADRLKSFSDAFHGIGHAILHEHNLWIHLVVTLVVIFNGLWFEVKRSDWVILLLCIGGVIAAELFNSAIEALADKVQPERDPVIGRVKDMAAGAVLVMAITASVVGLLVFFPYWV